VDITALKESDKAVLEAKQVEAATNAKNRLLAQFVTDTRVSVHASTTEHKSFLNRYPQILLLNVQCNYLWEAVDNQHFLFRKISSFSDPNQLKLVLY
jgi:hypothetical protein